MQDFIDSIKIHNWRRFENILLQIPKNSATIVDQNGSGKTSILSSVYSLFTGKPWPNTKFNQTLTFDQQYFGLSANNQWNLSGQFSPSGRVVVKYEKPENIENWPKVLTYTPTDNYLFSQSRTAKLSVLDDILSSLLSDEYSYNLSKLDIAVKAKQRLIKYTMDSGSTADTFMVQTLGIEVQKYSEKIWTRRLEFFVFWQKSLAEFGTWINSPLKNWKLCWHRTNQFGQKIIIKDNSLFSQTDFSLSLDFDWNKLWSRELASGKVLYGAQRDDFGIESDHLPVESVLSRGEMRLFILFIKNLAVEFANQTENLKSEVFYLYDDVFNELDDTRELKLFSEILSKQKWFLATSTRTSKIDCEEVSVESLKQNPQK